jgi:UDP-glucuronate 4-epimerase
LSIAKGIRYRFIDKSFGKKANIKMLEPQPGNVSVTYADITKAKQMLKYQPKVKMGEGVKRFVEWYKAQSIARRA